jgi:DNA-binding NtrC family response regulator
MNPFDAKLILLADANASGRALLSRVLSMGGHQLRPATTIGELDAWVAQGLGHGVVLDFTLLNAFSSAVLSRWQAQRANMPVIIINAPSLLVAQAEVTARPMGSVVLVAQPFDGERLLAALAKALAHGSAPADGAVIDFNWLLAPSAQVLELKPIMEPGSSSIEQTIDGILAQYFSMLSGTLPTPGLYDRLLAQLERPLICHTLRATHGNQIRAAEVLGINRNTLRKKMRLLNITSKSGWVNAA